MKKVKFLNYNLLLVILLFLAFTSCENPFEKTKVDGYLLNPVSGNGVKNKIVYLEELHKNVQYNRYIDSAITDENGKFNFTFNAIYRKKVNYYVKIIPAKYEGEYHRPVYFFISAKEDSTHKTVEVLELDKHEKQTVQLYAAPVVQFIVRIRNIGISTDDSVLTSKRKVYYAVKSKLLKQRNVIVPLPNKENRNPTNFQTDVHDIESDVEFDVEWAVKEEDGTIILSGVKKLNLPYGISDYGYHEVQIEIK